MRMIPSATALLALPLVLACSGEPPQPAPLGETSTVPQPVGLPPREARLPLAPGPYQGAPQVPRGFPVHRTQSQQPDAVLVELYVGVHAPLPALLAQTAMSTLAATTHYYLVAPDDTAKAVMRQAAAHQCLAKQDLRAGNLQDALTDTTVGSRERLQRFVPPPLRPSLETACPTPGVDSRWYDEVVSNRIRWQRLSAVPLERALPLLRIIRPGHPPELWPLATRTSWPLLPPPPRDE